MADTKLADTVNTWPGSANLSERDRSKYLVLAGHEVHFTTVVRSASAPQGIHVRTVREQGWHVTPTYHFNKLSARSYPRAVFADEHRRPFQNRVGLMFYLRGGELTPVLIPQGRGKKRQLSRVNKDL